MNERGIAKVHWHALRVTHKTCWCFVELEDGAGRRGVGEATLAGRETQMQQLLDARRGALIARRPEDVDLEAQRAQARTLAQFAVVSALDQAVQDLRARQDGISVADLLGGRRRERVAVYANINRGIAARTPDGFAAHARAAVRDGFSAVKIAPFDGVELYGALDKPADRALVDAGLARIAAVRDAIGPGVDLMVDCHWRLNRPIAEDVIRAIEPLRLYWLECPVPEKPELVETIRALRSMLNDRGVRLAGCEEMSRVAGFMPFLRAGCCDAMMPDVKYVGGLHEMLAVADALHAHGVDFSPHNPSGPVCHAASVQVCAAVAHVARLEMQYKETPVFDTLVGHTLPAPVCGEIEVPHTPGLGVALDADVMQALRDAAPGGPVPSRRSV